MPGIKGISIPQAVKVINANIAIKILIIVPQFFVINQIDTSINKFYKIFMTKKLESIN